MIMKDTDGKTFTEFALSLSDECGSPFGCGETEGDRDYFIENGNTSQDAWVICPYCGEPIYNADILNHYFYWTCPSCEFMEEEGE